MAAGRSSEPISHQVKFQNSPNIWFASSVYLLSIIQGYRIYIVLYMVFITHSVITGISVSSKIGRKTFIIENLVWNLPWSLSSRHHTLDQTKGIPDSALCFSWRHQQRRTHIREDTTLLSWMDSGSWTIHNCLCRCQVRAVLQTCVEPGCSHLRWWRDGSPQCSPHSLLDPQCWEWTDFSPTSNFIDRDFFYLVLSFVGKETGKIFARARIIITILVLAAINIMIN